MGVVGNILEYQLDQERWWSGKQKARKGLDGTLEAGNILETIIELKIDIKNAFGSPS
jgi:hypothetical protein